MDDEIDYTSLDYRPDRQITFTSLSPVEKSILALYGESSLLEGRSFPEGIPGFNRSEEHGTPTPNIESVGELFV